MTLTRDCPSGKIRFRDSKSATAYLHGLQAGKFAAESRGQYSSVTVQRKYLCPDCDGWHLTSKPAR